MNIKCIILSAAITAVMATSAVAQGLQFRMEWSPNGGPHAELLLDAPFGAGSNGRVSQAVKGVRQQGASHAGSRTQKIKRKGGKADLVIVGMQAKRLAKANRAGTCRYAVTFGVQNKGAGKAPVNMASLAVNGRSAAALKKRVSVLRTGQRTKKMRFVFAIKAGGTYHLTGTVDEQNAVAEKNERNNQKQIKVSCPS